MLDILRAVMQVPKLSCLKLVTPTNHVQAMDAWLEEAKKGHFTNPHFTYSDRRSEAKQSTLQLNELERKLPEAKSKEEAFVRKLIIQQIRRQCLVNTIAIPVATGDDNFTNGLLRDYYGRTSPELIETAYRIAAGERPKFVTLDSIPQKLKAEQAEASSNLQYDAQDIKKLFAGVLEDYKLLDDWEIVIGDDYSAITVQTASEDGGSKIYIPSQKTASEIAAIKLAGHEIEAHVRHNMNCAYLLERFFDIPHDLACQLVADRDSTLTEGFAKISDSIIEKRCTGKDSGLPLPWYVLAADWASKGESFAHVAERQHEEYGRSLKDCWKTTIRVFRGCHTTANMHHYAREADRCYLEGFLKAVDLYESHSPLFDYAKFDQETFDEILTIVDHPIETKYPFLNIVNGRIVNYL